VGHEDHHATRFKLIHHPILIWPIKEWFRFVFAYATLASASDLEMNMAEEIKAGDVVQLKSGGPEMTVEKLEPWNGVQTAWCQWFDKGQGLPQASRFPLTSLRVVEQ
jgi:uncharacterized protein YodC (DUF2158 family)